MASAFAFPRARVIGLAVAAALLAFVALQIAGARPSNQAGAAVGGVHISMTVTGAKTGKFKGDDTATKAAPNTITVLAYGYGLGRSSNPETGLPQGNAVHLPVTITHVMGGSSPQFLAAEVNGETLTDVTITFSRVSATTGKIVVFYQVKLTTAFVTQVAQRTSGDNVLEDVSFIFQKIEQKSLTANTDWIANTVTAG